MRQISAMFCRFTRFFVCICTAFLLAVPTFIAVAETPIVAGPSRTYEGTVLILISDDFENGRSTTTIFLQDRQTNERLELELTAEQAKSIRPGQTLRVNGRRTGNILSVEGVDGALAVLREAAVEAAPQTARRVLTLIVDITDGSGVTHSVSSVCDGTDQLVADINFGSQTGQLNVDGCFQDGSFGALGVGGRVYPGSPNDVVRVAVTAPSVGGCDWSLWATRADAAATAQGVNLGQYQHRVYVLPANVGCPWSGLAFVGCGESCQAWMKAYSHLPCGYPDTFAHELGHNIGLGHARTDADNDGVLDCEYCDTSSVMGYSVDFWRSFNAPEKELLGWLAPSRIVDGTLGGTFQISALEMENPPYPQAVKLRSSSGNDYWISFRAAIGYDAQLVDKPNYFDGTDYLEETQVHYVEDGQRNTHLIASLPDGSEYRVINLDLSVKQLSHSAESAVVQVRLDGGCSDQPVPVSLSPSARTARVVPATRTFTLSLTNEDDANCEAVASPLVADAPPGWSASLSDQNPVVTPGSTVNVTLTVTAPAGTQEGNYPVGVTMTGNAAVELKSSMYIDATAPEATIAIPENGTTYARNLTLSASYSCSDAVSYVTGCVGTVANGSPFDTTTLGPKTFTVTATDRAGNVKSTTVSYTVVPPSPAFVLSHSAMSFNQQPINVTSAAKVLTLLSTGNGPLAINSISLTGANASQFTFSSHCTSPVPVGANCTIDVRFRPTSTGSKIADLVVTGGGTAGSKSVRLSGTGTNAGIAFTVSPTSRAFGNRPRNTVSPAKAVTVTNTGTVLLPITSIAIAGRDPSQFAQTNNCPAQVAVGNSCTVNVVFKPTTRGDKSATLRVVPGGGASVKKVALTGTGT